MNQKEVSLFGQSKIWSCHWWVKQHRIKLNLLHLFFYYIVPCSNLQTLPFQGGEADLFAWCPTRSYFRPFSLFSVLIYFISTTTMTIQFAVPHCEQNRFNAFLKVRETTPPSTSTTSKPSPIPLLLRKLTLLRTDFVSGYGYISFWLLRWPTKESRRWMFSKNMSAKI